jgi:ribosomal protein S18 acetylase RimI-like enzyme
VSLAVSAAVELRTLAEPDLDELPRLVTGYVSTERYRVALAESGDEVTFTLVRVALPEPYVRRWDAPDAEALASYRRVVAAGFSLGAYRARRCLGMAIAEPHWWHKSLWLREIHVAEEARRLGVGRQLMAELARRGRAAGMRTIVCETQNTNGPAIAFYRRMGCRVEGIDVSYYSNDDYPDGEVAIFLKLRLV